MTPTNSRQSSVVEKFRELHAAGCFVLPNPWDAGSAIYLEQLGFKALASTSAGFAFPAACPIHHSMFRATWCSRTFVSWSKLLHCR